MERKIKLKRCKWRWLISRDQRLTSPNGNLNIFKGMHRVKLKDMNLVQAKKASDRI